ncbi:E1-E2 ATPase subfamily protein [Toxoplasma gondii ARI]|uniref:E1-E2 ATPase subfamily protein n=1 Tax=Toxoplasma gondii ARI TaxID=1074872 RepID=A0A139Y2E5_TOXGO|nr:E1-E2 ATPase subfamily protein [Toxoplasma gondii ARI]
MEQPSTDPPSAPPPARALFFSIESLSLSELCSGERVPLPLESTLTLLVVATSTLFFCLLLWRFRKLRLEHRPSDADLPPSGNSQTRTTTFFSVGTSSVPSPCGDSGSHVSAIRNNEGEGNKLKKEKEACDGVRRETAGSSDQLCPDSFIPQRGYRRSWIGLVLHIFLYAVVFSALLLMLSLVAVETCIPVSKSDLLWRDRAVSFIALWIFVFSGLYGLQLFHSYLPWFFRLRCPLSEATAVCFVREPTPCAASGSNKAGPSDEALPRLRERSAEISGDETACKRDRDDEVEPEEDDHEREGLNAEAPDSISRVVARVREESFACALSLFFGITRAKPSGEGKEAKPFHDLVNSSCLSLVPVQRVKVTTGVSRTFPITSIATANSWKDSKETKSSQRDSDQTGCRVVCWEGRRHVYCPHAGRFVLSRSELPKAERTRQAISDVIKRGGISDAEALRRLRLFGVNAVPVAMPTLTEALKGELSDVMFLFQFLLVCNSFYWRSYLASSIWALLAVYGILARVWIAHKSQMKVKRLAEEGSATLVCVLRQTNSETGTFENPLYIPAQQLVPGDLVLLSPGMTVPADLVLCDGSAVMDESELTGETKPIQKLPWLPHRLRTTNKYGKTEDSRENESSPAENDNDTPFFIDRPSMRKSILFAGTHVISAAGSKASVTGLPRGRSAFDYPANSVHAGVSSSPRNDPQISFLSYEASSACLAVVARTGSSTARGSLLRRTLSSSIFLFKYDAQLPAVFLIMLCYAAVVICILCKCSPNATGVAGWFYALGTLSQLLPVWTPVLIARAQAASAQRLQETKQILTLAPQRLAVCGKARVVCFDKTGTLTQHGMQFAGVLATSRSSTRLSRAVPDSQTDQQSGTRLSESAGTVHSAEAHAVSFERNVRPVTAAWNWGLGSLVVSEDRGKRVRSPSSPLHREQCPSNSDDGHLVKEETKSTDSLEDAAAKPSTEQDQNLLLLGLSACHALALKTPGSLLRPAEILVHLDVESKLRGYSGGRKACGASWLEDPKAGPSENEELSVHVKASETGHDEDQTDEGNVFLGSDLEKRMVQATGWRLLMTLHGEEDHQASAVWEQDRPARWMLPPQFEERARARRDMWLPILSSPAKDSSSPLGEWCGHKMADKVFLDSGAVEILHVFPFDYSLQRMSVVVRRGSSRRCVDQDGVLTPDSFGDETLVFCKGSYESVGPLCTSGLPADFTGRCNSLALQGFYVLALAYKPVPSTDAEPSREGNLDPEAAERHQRASKPVKFRSRHKSKNKTKQPLARKQPGKSVAPEINETGAVSDTSDTRLHFDSHTCPPASAIPSSVGRGHQKDALKPPSVLGMSRDSVENGLRFLGLILFRNELKADAAEAIRQLKQGRVRPVMITGDSVLTAVCVARLCGMTGEQCSLSYTSFCGENTCSMRSLEDNALENATAELQASERQISGPSAVVGPLGSAYVPDAPAMETRQNPPTVLVAEFKNPQDSQSGLIWRDADIPHRVFSETEVYQGLLTAGGMCDLAVTETVLEYLASTPVSDPNVYTTPLRASKAPIEDARFFCSSSREGLFVPEHRFWSDRITVDTEETVSLLESGSPDGTVKQQGSYACYSESAPRETPRSWAYWRRAAAALGFSLGRRRSSLKMLGSCDVNQSEGHDRTSLLDVLLMRIRIFARMSPQGKRRIVLAFMRRGFVTCMCGDGGNDCAALRAAHAGLAFSTSSASVLAPFTATSLQPTAAADLLKEGRCSLATALSAYKFLVVYGVLLSFVKSVLLIFGGGSCMSQAIYFLMDVAILLGLSKVMVLARPKESLRIRSPTSSLLGPTTIVSVCIMLLVDFLFIVCLYSQLRATGLGVDVDYQATLPPQAWWMRSDTYEAASCAIWVCVQLTNTAFVFSLGGMFRDRVYRNRALIISTAVLQLFFIAITFLPTSSISCLMRINCTDAASRAVNLPVPAWMARPAAGMPLYNPRGHNIFPFPWKVQLTILSLANAIVNIIMARFLFSAAFLKFLRTHTNSPGESDNLMV